MAPWWCRRDRLTAPDRASRVYLHVHYLSDVSGGWALGVGAFSLCAAVALVITTVRHNGGPMPDSSRT